MTFSEALGHRGRAYSGADRDHTVGEGIVIALADHPTFVILKDDGTHLHWAAHLVEVGEPVPDTEYDERVAASLGYGAPDTWSRGAWMQTFTGRQFYPLDPTADDVDPLDIAHALSLLCRYGGHSRRFYSVAEHCVLMSHAVAPEHALWALLHDATEAYVGDMVRPLKQQLPAYQDIEARVWSAIALRFGLREVDAMVPDMPVEVKAADNRILLDERAAVLSPPPADWAVEDLEPLGVQIQCWDPVRAEFMYAHRLRQLGRRRRALVAGDGPMTTCPHRGPFKDGDMPCTNTEPDHDHDAELGHSYAASAGIHGRPVRDEE